MQIIPQTPDTGPAWGEYVRVFLAKHRLSRADFAALVGKGDTTAKKWANGELPHKLERIGIVLVMQDYEAKRGVQP
jgi:hypothetical protein